MIFEACTGQDIMAVDMPQMTFPRDVLEGMSDRIHYPELSCVMRDETGKPLACFGINPMWEGVGEAWAFISLEATKYPVALSRAAKRQLDITMQVRNFRRVQCVVKEDDLVHHRWAQWLGFEPEGILRNYGYGGRGSVWIYSRIRGET